MKLHALTKAITLATLLSAVSLGAMAADIPLAGVVLEDQTTATVVSVDTANHQVVLKGPEGKEVSVQLTDKAKNLGNLKAGDQVDIKVIHAEGVVFNTDVSKALPGSAERTGDVRAAPGSAKPAGEAYRQVEVQLKITHIDLKKNQVTFEGPKGKSKTVDIVRPEVQAKLKDLKVGQTVVVTYTDILQVHTHAPKS